MNVYGYIPTSYFPPHSTLAYWAAQAASFAALPSSESTLTATGFVLGLKKSQLPLPSNDVIQKTRNRASPTCSDELVSLFGVNPRLSSHPADTVPALFNNGSIDLYTHIQQQHHHLRKQQQQQQQQIQQHRFTTSSPPVNPALCSGLAPLQALCASDVSAFVSKTSAISDKSNSSLEAKGGLKFGMSRILSEDFGKSKCEKENFQVSSVAEPCRSLPLCPCNSSLCAAYGSPRSPYGKVPLPSLTAVHALQPPTYPMSSSADALPGPYSVLSTDNSIANQPKRKRSWSRAVFSNLQRKGLEKRFEVQKYVTKPDRRQLAAMLGLTDAQVKVWFQNRRMKWRHAQQQGEKEKQNQQPELAQGNESSKHLASGHPDLQTSATSTARVPSPGLVKLPQASHDYTDPVAGDDVTDIATDHCPEPGRQHCTSPQDLSVGQCASDCPREAMTVALSSSSVGEQFVGTESCTPSHTTSHSHPGETHLGQGQELGSRLHQHCHRVNSQEVSIGSSGYQQNVDNSSPVSLDMDSDVDVNDTDVDIADSEDGDDDDDDDDAGHDLMISNNVYFMQFGMDN